jgi:hypothetical protein
MRDEPLFADGAAAVIGVLAAVDLDDEPLLSTDKIYDIRPDRFLTHEFESGERSGASYLQSLRSAAVEFFRNCRAKLVFVTLASRMRRGPLTPPSPRARGEGVVTLTFDRIPEPR